MAETYNGRKRIRKQFGSIGEVAEMPNLIEVQKSSYDDFLMVKEPPGGRSAVDFLVGDPTSEEATLAGQTVEQPRPTLSTTGQDGTLDLQALSASATKDQDQAQTLLEALTLLQRDYEDELTASQVLEQSAVRAILGKELDEPTQIREPEARTAAPRAKSG